MLFVYFTVTSKFQSRIHSRTSARNITIYSLIYLNFAVYHIYIPLGGKMLESISYDNYKNSLRDFQNLLCVNSSPKKRETRPKFTIKISLKSSNKPESRKTHHGFQMPYWVPEILVSISQITECLLILSKSKPWNDCIVLIIKHLIKPLMGIFICVLFGKNVYHSVLHCNTRPPRYHWSHPCHGLLGLAGHLQKTDWQQVILRLCYVTRSEIVRSRMWRKKCLQVSLKGNLKNT